MAHTKVSLFLVSELLYIDDCVIVTHSENEMQHFMNDIAHTWVVFGLEVSLNNTVVMHDLVPALPNIEPAIYVEGKKRDILSSFLYLGSTLTEECNFDKDISLCTVKVPGFLEVPVV